MQFLPGASALSVFKQANCSLAPDNLLPSLSPSLRAISTLFDAGEPLSASDQHTLSRDLLEYGEPHEKPHEEEG